MGVMANIPSTVPMVKSPLMRLLHKDTDIKRSALAHFCDLRAFMLPLLASMFVLVRFLVVHGRNVSNPLWTELCAVGVLGRSFVA